jgi:putative tryptophan/tyrosine transport system substrate-binding protein
MRRRDFTKAIVGSAIAWPLAARAQQPTIGLLSGTGRDPLLLDAIQQGLSEAGYVEGRNLKVEYRFAEGQLDRLPELAADLVRRGVAVIITIQSAAASFAAKGATSTIPIIFSIGGDPVKLGLVSSLNRPDGNVTGTTFLVNTLAAKRLELLHELLPSARLIGLLVNPGNPATPSETSDVQAAAHSLGLETYVQNASREQEIDAAFDNFVERQVNALTFASDAVLATRRDQLVALAARHALPTMYFVRQFADAGGLMSYGGKDTDARLAGAYAGRVLKGAKPADLPVQQVTKVELVINLKTAKTLGLIFPITLLGRADQVIE